MRDLQVPKTLQNQLGMGGRLIIPIGEKGCSQALTIIDRNMDGNLTIQSVGKVVYVPLTSLRNQLGYEVQDEP